MLITSPGHFDHDDNDVLVPGSGATWARPPRELEFAHCFLEARGHDRYRWQRKGLGLGQSNPLSSPSACFRENACASRRLGAQALALRASDWNVARTSGKAAQDP
jgi:hypothetical protein